MPPKNIKQIYEESLANAKASQPISIQRGKLFKWKGSISNFVIGELKCHCSPNFGFIILDSSHFISCIILNPMKNVNKLLQLCNHTILLNEPECIVEIFTAESSESVLMHIILDAEKLRIIEKNIKLFKMSLKEAKNDDLVVRNVNSILTEWHQKVVPLKISSAILTSRSEVFCFVLVLLIDSEQVDYEKFNKNTEFVWLILKNSHVVWKEFLLPNRIYTIINSPEIPRDYFTRYSSLISVIDKNVDLTFHQMLHHKDLIKTTAVVFLPHNSKIYTSLQNPLKIACAERWFSISDERLKSLKFASVYGIIKDILYFESWKTMNCLWCDENPSEEFHIQNLKKENDLEPEYKCSKPFSELNNSTEINKIWFPETYFNISEEKKNGFGIRGGKLSVQIALKDCSSTEVAYIYLKRWQQLQYPAGLIKGTVVCFTDLNIKRSKKNNFYFINTPLTRIFHLNSAINSRNVSSDIWGKFGFPFLKKQNEKIWGILDLDMLSKVSISAKCKLCSQSFLQFCCSNVLCSNSQKQMNPDYEVHAVARLFVRGFVGSEASSLFIKNENVQKYLGIPNRIWRKLCHLSANAELLYVYYKDEDEYLNENQDVISIFFQTYCKFFRPKLRFHVLCRPFQNDENRFFCIELAEITEERLLETRAALERKMIEEDKC